MSVSSGLNLLIMRLVQQLIRCYLVRPEVGSCFRGFALPELLSSARPDPTSAFRPHLWAPARLMACQYPTLNGEDPHLPPGVAQTVWEQEKQVTRSSAAAHMLIHVLEI